MSNHLLPLKDVIFNRSVNCDNRGFAALTDGKKVPNFKQDYFQQVGKNYDFILRNFNENLLPRQR